MNFDNMIAQHGTSVTLNTVTLPGANTTDAESYSATTIPVILNEVTEKNRVIQDTILQDGDLVAYLKSGQAVKLRDVIVYNSRNWEVIGISQVTYMGAVTYKKVGLKKQ